MGQKHNDEKKRITEAVNKSTGTKFCSHCRSYQRMENGGWVVTANRSRRWKCSNCMGKKSERNRPS